MKAYRRVDKQPSNGIEALTCFDHQIGGLVINIENNIRCSIRLEEATEYRDFLRLPNSSMADIHISMESASTAYPPGPEEPVLLSQYFKIVSRPNGYLALRYHNKLKQLPYLTVHTDKQFSKMHFCFYPHRTDSGQAIPADPVRSAGDFLLLQHSFINHQGLIVHAGGGSIRGKGMVFAGVSGAGKSTLTHLLSSSPDNQLFSDERLIIRYVDSNWCVWGTPWQGSGCIARNKSAPLSALIFLSQAEETKISQLSPQAGLHRLMQVASIPWYSEEWVHKGLAICERLVQDIPVYELAFTPDQNAVEVVEDLTSLL